MLLLLHILAFIGIAYLIGSATLLGWMLYHIYKFYTTEDK